MAEFIKIYPDKPSESAVAKVVKVLKEGGLVIYPTDTVYGLGCDITNTKALGTYCPNQRGQVRKSEFFFYLS
jgi:tRNA A37 threonylcarbamoyladenosine synthetase subunit TsaC/SUA5/YrdC